MDGSQATRKEITDDERGATDAPDAQCRGAVPHAASALVPHTASAAKCLLDVVARETSAEPIPRVTSQQVVADTGRLSQLRCSPGQDASRGLDDLLRASASPMARSPHAPRSPFSVRASSAPSSPELAAAAHLQRHNLGLAPSTSSLEYMLANGPSLHNSLSCSSFLQDGQFQLPSISPEPFSELPAAPLAAFRQHRLHSPLSAIGQVAHEAPARWMPAIPLQTVWPTVGPRLQEQPGSDRMATSAALPSGHTSHRGRRAQEASARTTLSDTAPAESQAVSVDDWSPSRSRRSKRSRGQRTAAAEAHPSRRAARGWRGGGAAASAPGERAAAPPAIKRLLAHHGNRGVTEFRSVSLMVRTGRYDVTPHHFKRQVYLGSYETAEQAGRVADLAEVAAGKTGTRLNFEGEYGAEVERAAEVAAQPGMTDEGFKAWVLQTHEHIKNINRAGRAGLAAEELDCVPSSLQTHISQMVHQDSISLGFYLSKDRATSAYDQVMVQALGLKAQTNFSITNYKHLLSEEDLEVVEKAERQIQAGSKART